MQVEGTWLLKAMPQKTFTHLKCLLSVSMLGVQRAGWSDVLALMESTSARRTDRKQVAAVGDEGCGGNKGSRKGLLKLRAGFGCGHLAEGDEGGASLSRCDKDLKEVGVGLSV